MCVCAQSSKNNRWAHGRYARLLDGEYDVDEISHYVIMRAILRVYSVPWSTFPPFILISVRTIGRKTHVEILPEVIPGNPNRFNSIMTFFPYRWEELKSNIPLSRYFQTWIYGLRDQRLARSIYANGNVFLFFFFFKRILFFRFRSLIEAE